MKQYEFHPKTIAIRLHFRKGSVKQSQIFYPSPTLTEAMSAARKEMFAKLADNYKCRIGEAKQIRV